MPDNEQVFIRTDLQEAGQHGIAYYRLDAKMRAFLNKCLDNCGPVEAVILERDEDGQYDWNIGFAIPPRKAN